MTPNELLQIINIGLTSGVLLALLGAAVAYGRLQQKVDDQGKNIVALWEKTGEIEKKVWAQHQ